MKELLDQGAVERVLLIAAVSGPLVGLIIGAVAGARGRCFAPRIAAGVLIGALCSLAYGMWRVYGALTDVLGLDSALNLVLQIMMFAVFGVALGVAIPKVSTYLKGLRARR